MSQSQYHAGMSPRDRASALVSLFAIVALALPATAAAQSGAAPQPAASAPAAAAAQPPPSQPPPPPTVTAEIPMSVAANPESALSRVLRSGCRDGLADVRALGGSPNAPWADTVTRLCDEIVGQNLPAPPMAAIRSGSGTNEGRGRLVLWSSLYGIWYGVATDILFDISGDRAVILPPLLGMAAGLGISLAATRDMHLTVGEAWTIITGLDYGTFNGALWAGGFDLSDKGVVGAALATSIAATSVGLLVANTYSPSAGDVELVRSSLLWGTIGGFLATVALAPDVSSGSALKATAAAMDVGLIVGVALANSVELSRNRVLIIDAGALTGGLTGLGIAWLASGSGGDQLLPGAALGGMLAGIAVAAYATRDLDDDHDLRAARPAFPALVARDPDGSWGFGAPGAVPLFDGRGRSLVGATVTALGGQF
jgi:hypothetical protein